MSSKPVDDNVDFLTEDQEIPGQKFVLLSFLSPEKVLAKKDLFFFEKFLADYEINWKTKNLEKYLAETVLGIKKTLETEAVRLEALDLSGASVQCRESARAFRIEEVLDTYHAYVKKNQKELSTTVLKEAYDDFLYRRQKELEDAFYTKNNFQTSMRGLKVRGVWGSAEEATARAKKLQRADQRHNILLGEVGKWLPWDPSPHEIAEQEYAEEQLNTLMKNYNKNEDDRDEFYRQNPQAKTAKNEKSVFNMSLQPNETESATTATNTIFEGPADLALQRKMEAAAKVTDSA
jgi:hypothetical protein